jgi:hypothetical protein
MRSVQPSQACGSMFGVSCTQVLFLPANYYSTEFTKKHPEFVVHDNSVGFISDSGGATYNLCHCGSSSDCGLCH